MRPDSCRDRLRSSSRRAKHVARLFRGLSTALTLFVFRSSWCGFEMKLPSLVRHGESVLRRTRLVYSLLRLAVTTWLFKQGKDDLNSTSCAGIALRSIHR